MNQGKLEVVKQETARVNIDILGISELNNGTLAQIQEIVKQNIIKFSVAVKCSVIGLLGVLTLVLYFYFLLHPKLEIISCSFHVHCDPSIGTSYNSTFEVIRHHLNCVASLAMLLTYVHSFSQFNKYLLNACSELEIILEALHIVGKTNILLSQSICSR